MKKLLFLFILLILTSCKSLNLEKSTEVFVYDFTEYDKKGFLFTPENYNNDYSSMGIIFIELFPEVKEKEKNEKEQYPYDQYSIGQIKSSEAIEALYKRAMLMGANAIIRFKIEGITKHNGPMLIDGIRVSGFAIKRK